MLYPKPLLMGVLNITPDSFSDGGKFLNTDAALRHADKLIQEGADILDIGGESTRPGAEPVTAQQEMDRILPVIEKIRQAHAVRISVDTTKFEVAKEALKIGATIINDITGGNDVRLGPLVKETQSTLILMHMQGTPQTMQQNPVYADGVVSEVKRFLRNKIRSFREFGIAQSQLWIDPGIGFGKTVHHNLDLLRHVSDFLDIGSKIVLGTSRKSFLAHLSGNPQLPMELRESPTIASNLWATAHGASVLRVHDVGAMNRALKTWAAIEDACF